MDPTTHLVLLQFHIKGQYLLLLSARNVILPPCLPIFGDLFKLVHARVINFILFWSRFRKTIWFFSFLIGLTNLFNSIISQNSRFLNLARHLHALKLISGLDIRLTCLNDLTRTEGKWLILTWYLTLYQIALLRVQLHWWSRHLDMWIL